MKHPKLAQFRALSLTSLIMCGFPKSGTAVLAERVTGAPPTAESSQKVETKAAAATSSNLQSPVNDLATASAPQNGGMGIAQRAATNAASSAAMDQSAYVDSLYANGLINQNDWLKLKAGMTNQLASAVQQAARGQAPISAAAAAPSASSSSASPAVGAVSDQALQTSPLTLSSNSIGASPSTSSLPPIAESNPVEVGAGAQVLSLQSSGSRVIGTTLVPDTVSGPSSASTSPAASGTAAKTTANSKSNQIALLSSLPNSNHAGEPDADQKAILVAQKLLQDEAAKKADKNAGAGKDADTGVAASKANPSDMELAQARAMASLKGLSAVKRVQDAGAPTPGLKFTPEQIVAAVSLPARSPAALKEDLSDEAEEGLSNISLFFMGLLGAFAGLAVVYGVFMRPQKSYVQLMVPGNGEHFTIRPAPTKGEYVLDIMDTRGKLVKTAGTLRPNSVARAAVLPPEMAARLGAKGSFERFELTHDGTFVATEKDEGYQIFPFVLGEARKAS